MISNRKKNSGTPDRCDQCVERRPGEIASRAPAESGGGYAVQVLSQRNEEEVQSLTERKVQSVGGRSGGAGGEE